MISILYTPLYKSTVTFYSSNKFSSYIIPKEWCLKKCNQTQHFTDIHQPDSLWQKKYIYSRVPFCNRSFYDDSPLRHLSSQTEHYRHVVHHCHNSSVISLLSALLALFRCAHVSSFSILVPYIQVDCDFSTHDVHQKDRKKNIRTVNVTFCLHVFWTTAWAFFNKLKSDLIDIFLNYLCYFLYT